MSSAPGTPLATKKGFSALKPFLVARGVPGAEDIPDRVKHNPLIKA